MFSSGFLVEKVMRMRPICRYTTQLRTECFSQTLLCTNLHVREFQPLAGKVFLQFSCGVQICWEDSKYLWLVLFWYHCCWIVGFDGLICRQVDNLEYHVPLVLLGFEGEPMLRRSRLVADSRKPMEIQNQNFPCNTASENMNDSLHCLENTAHD